MPAAPSSTGHQDFIDVGLPLRTPRLIMRAPVASDAVALHTRRNDPSVARWQSWLVPFPLKEAEAIIEGAATMAGPTPDQWWMLTIETGSSEPEVGVVIGDVAIGLDPSGTIVELGYSLATPSWGRGFATEAVAAVVDALFRSEPALVRIAACLHPDNHASAGVVERCGFLYEGRPRSSFPPRHENEGHSDGLIYGLTRADHEQWIRRPVNRPQHVDLVEVTNDNLDEVFDLATHKSQERLVAPVSFSLGEALHPPARDGTPVEVWHRAVMADGELVGFVMMGFRPAMPAYLWRMLIDRRHQRRGIGRPALDLVVEEARRRGATEVAVSWMPGTGSPEPFYLGYGFRPNGDADDDGEIPGILSI